MRFDIVISEMAELQYDNILRHISENLKNSQALIAIMDDFDETLSVLENSADSFAFCENTRLKDQGFRKLLFMHHRYLFIYRIIPGNKVVIEGIYHELQDYEKAL